MGAWRSTIFSPPSREYVKVTDFCLEFAIELAFAVIILFE